MPVRARRGAQDDDQAVGGEADDGADAGGVVRLHGAARAPRGHHSRAAGDPQSTQERHT